MTKDISVLFEQLVKGDRVALGQALTLVESELAPDRIVAVQLLELCHHHLETRNESIRLAISGAPGAGKSSLIEAIGMKAITNGYTVGILTIDPTSNISHGSILGDKSRMPRLSVSPSAFVRSSAAGTVLGGISRRSFEMMTLLEAIGYDIILLETVGVGQSEHISWQLTDGFILVLQPGGGDELQGIKRGITELADIILVNKSDGSLREAAMISRSHYQNAVHYLSPLRQNWEPKVLTSSALEGTGVDEFWDVLRLYIDSQLKTGQKEINRTRQNKFWLNWSLGNTAHQLLINHPEVQQKLNVALDLIETNGSSMFKTEFDIEKLMARIMVTGTNIS